MDNIKELHQHSNYGKSSLLNKFILGLITLVYVLMDWSLYVFAMSEFVIAIIFLLLFFLKKLYLKPIDLRFAIALTTLLVTHNVINFIFNPSFIERLALAGTLKIMFLLFFVLTSYRLINEFQFKKLFLIILNYSALIVVLVGVYIVIAIQTGNYPYEFIWTFTRDDKTSYFLMETIRMRSVFSEPAHMGYFLNSILSINLFTQYDFKFKKLLSLVMIGGIILTFSYSSIIITTIIMVTKLTLLIANGDLPTLDSKVLLLLIPVVILLFYRWEFFYRTIIIRTSNIIQGQDTSALSRFFDSWMYLSIDNVFTGNGIGNSPPITNIYAYMLTDFGLPIFLISIFITIILLKNNIGIGLTFLLLNIQKGGYLSPAFAFVVLLLFLYTNIYSEMLKIGFAIKNKMTRLRQLIRNDADYE